MNRDEIQRRITILEEKLKAQREGHYCHWTGSNIAMLNNAIYELKQRLNPPAEATVRKP